MVNVYQVAVQIHVLISSGLDRGIGRLGGNGAWWEGELGEQGVRPESDQ